MKILNIFLLNLISLFLFYNSIAQEIAIGQWREHLPYNKCIALTEGDNKIYCATPYSLFYYNKDDNSVERISKVTGLNDIGISTINYNKQYGTLLIAYSNANIDLIKDNTIINISDIKRSDAITPQEKTINKILFINKYAYLSCGFGIVVLDIEKEEIHDTYYIGPDGSHIKVFDFTYNDTAFFAATEIGIFHASIDNPNLAYYESWSKDTLIIEPNAEYNAISSCFNKIFVNKRTSEWTNDTLFFYNGVQWSYFDTTHSNDINNIKEYDDELVIVYPYSVDSYDSEFNKIKNIWTYNPEGPQPSDAIIDNNIMWIADKKNGLVRRNNSWDFTIIKIDGPESIDVYAMSLEGNDLWTVPGGMDPSWSNIWNQATVSSFLDENWFTYNSSNTPAMDTLRDIVSIAVDPLNTKRVYAGTWCRGLLEFNNNDLTRIYDSTNSSLRFIIVEGPPVIKIGGLYFDDNNNLWVTNSGAYNILSVRMPDGTSEGYWQSFYLGSSSSGKDVGKIIIDSYNQKWILMREDHSIIVFNDNNTITNTNDDQAKKIGSGQGNGNIPGNKVYSIAVDLDGEVWIGTDKGVAVFYSPENVFTDYDYDAQQILVEQDGYVQHLLEFETVTAIAVDGANNKWMGTDKAGVFLLSDDGTEEIHHFTENNSPLLSNSVTSIVINDNTGEIFFGTANGIISYKGIATSGEEKFKDVYAYPNPVREGYSGVIAIKGLVKNADIKITNISGTLIYETKAEGGQAIWNGRNFNGDKAHSGVYLVFASNEDGTETLVTKILFIN
ncbi:MAG: T9SS type A sorting domain-containing protein [Bacteroidales bacterium]|nr:T9SS type A sorting domain-containing protein [Bacteroidales bacterium]